MTTKNISFYSFPTSIHFGAGARELLSEKLSAHNIKRPLLVTDKGFASLTEFQSIKTLLAKSHSSETFSGIIGNPVCSQVDEGVQTFRNHKADCVVAIGGGAAMDVAKAIALMVHHPGHLFDYEDGKPDCLPFDKPIPLLIALPTTSGTGSEVGRSTVISDDVSKVKKIIFHPRLLPSLVIADPELTLNLPPSITAATGMDALSHLMESFIAKGSHPICEGIALEGLHLLSQSLNAAVNSAQNKTPNIHARSMMMQASMMGAIAFQKGLGVTHSCAHALSTVCDMHHGLANGIMIPYAMEFNLSAAPERFARIANMIGLNGSHPEKVISWLYDLKMQIGIPARLSDAGVNEKHIQDLTNIAINDGCHQSNPRAVSKSDFHNLFMQSL